MKTDKMLCEAKCDAGGPNQRVDTIGNLGLWTRLGIPTKATRLRTHHLVRFFLWISKFFLFLLAVADSCGAGCFYSNQCLQFQPISAPRTKSTQNCDAKFDAMWYNLWEIKDRI